MRYSAIKTCDIHNGDGLRVTLWLQGCGGYCKECHNKESWDKTKGKEFTDKEYNIICRELKKGQNLSILGGEPLEEYNIEGLTTFLKSIKEDFPNLNIWLWTHYKYEDIQDIDLINYIDVVVDGKYIPELKCDFRESGIEFDKWRGSSNQNIIKIKEINNV